MSKILKSKSFYIAYVVTFFVFIASAVIMAIDNRAGYVFIMAVALFDAPYAIIGMLAGVFVIKKSKYIALGIMLGGVTPLLIMSILSCFVKGL